MRKVYLISRRLCALLFGYDIPKTLALSSRLDPFEQQLQLSTTNLFDGKNGLGDHVR